MRPTPVQVMGDVLPPDIDYLGFDEAIDLLSIGLAGLNTSSDQEEQRQGLIRLLHYFVNNKFCQTFILEELAFHGPIAHIAREVPYICINDEGHSEGNYVINFDIDKKLAECGDYRGQLTIPADSLRYGVSVFKKTHLSPEDKERIESQSLNAASLEIDTTFGRDQRLKMVRNVLREIDIRAEKLGISIDRNKMPGIKKDLSELLQKRFQKELGGYSKVTFHQYYEDCGIKFRPGSRSVTIWKDLFPEYY